MEGPSENPTYEAIDNDLEILDDSNSNKRKSIVWSHFSLETDKDGNGSARCDHCKISYAYKDSKYGTSTLNRHLDRCKKKPRFGDVSSMFLDHEGKLRAKGKLIDQKTCREWITRISVAHDLPLKWIEYKNMRGFLKYLNPDIKFVTRNTVANDVVKMYESEKEKLKLTLKNIPGSVCLTSDCWTACTTKGYICVTAHYVDAKWKLNSKILAFCEMPPPHSGPELAQKIYDCLVDWGIDRKVFSLTLDNASANNHMVRVLKARLLLQNSLMCNGDYFHIRCCAHILNLIVQEGLKVVDDALDKIRASVKYVRGSDARKIKFKECAAKTGIQVNSSVCMDVSTRWNATYSMLVRAIKYRRVFTMLSFDDLDYKYCPTEEEWERGERMCEFLRPFEAMTRLISGSSYPTSNLYFMEVWKIARCLEKNSQAQDNVVRDMSIKMKVKFEKYWEEYSDILAMGAVFDPRVKLNFLEYCYSKVDPDSSKDKIAKLKAKLYLLYDEYKKRGTSSFKISTSNSQVGQSSQREERQGKGRGLDLDASELDDYRSYKGGASGDAKSSLDIYLAEDQLDEAAKLDVLDYWKVNESRFGDLARMASDVLSIPITTVTSESTFSIGAHVLNKYRNRLLPAKVQALICTRNWLHGYPSDDEEDDIDDGDDAQGTPSATKVPEECHSDT